MTSSRLIFLPHDPDGEAPVLTIDEVGRVSHRATLTPGDPAAAVLMDGDVVIVPGVEVALHWLSLPARSQRQARAVAAVLIEEALASADPEIHIAVGEMLDGGERMTAAVSRARMQAWLDQARRLGVVPAVLTPASAILPEPEEDELLAANLFPGELALRGRRFAAAIEPELLDAVAAGRAVRRIEDALEVEALVVRGARAPAVNLLQGPFAVGGAAPAGLAPWRRVAVLAGVLLASPLLLWAGRIAIDSWIASSADRRAEAIADRLAPHITPGRPADERLAMRLAELDGGERFLKAAAVLYAVVEKTPGAAVTNMFYGSNGQIRATISHTNYSDAEGMKSQAALFGYALAEDATSTEGGRVMTDIVLEAAP